MSDIAHVTDEGESVTETHTIASTQITVDHPIDPAEPVTILGYTQVSTPIPAATEFFVNYASGVISFNAAATGSAVVTYISLGENVSASIINAMIDAINSAGMQAEIITHTWTVVGGVAVDETITPTRTPKDVHPAYLISGFGYDGAVALVEEADAATAMLALSEVVIYILGDTVKVTANADDLSPGSHTIKIRVLS